MRHRLTRPVMVLAALTAALAGGTAQAGHASAAAPQRLAATLAAVPPMGWNGYNHWGTAVTGAEVEASARALVSSGMAAAGYTYVSLDGGWALPQRDAGGNLQPDPAKFPGGIRALADYVHGLGLKFGIYESAGTANCAGTMAGGYGHYRQDAAQFASWGADYIKFDYCAMNQAYADNPGLTQQQVGQQLATAFGQAIAATGRPMVFDVNDASGARDHDQVWTWARAAGAQLWRVSSDISDTYSSMVSHIAGPASGHSYDLQLAQFAGPGGWNDPDMLEVGNGGMNAAQDRDEFSLWAEEAAPLIAGNDLATMSATTRMTLTNTEVIAVDQDPLGRQGLAVAAGKGHYVLVKPLADGSVAVLLFNQSASAATISTRAAAAGLPKAAHYAVRNLWAHTTSTTAGAIKAKVAAHGVVMYRVTAG